MKHFFSFFFAVATLVSCHSSTNFESVDTVRFSKIIANKEVQLIDVRTPEEFSEGHIPGAINIDVKGEGFDEKVAQLDKSQPVAIYCRSGSRSKLAAERMANAGFKVTELSEGILSWKGEVVK